MGALRDLLGRLDPDPYRRGKQFEHICKWFLENDPTYQPLLRRVWLWDDWPGRTGIDAGIDLVAEDHDRKLWAIQAKAYDPAYSVSKRDVDKFIAESSRKTFTYRLLIGTTDKRHHLATKLMDDLGIPFVGLTQLRDADDYLDWPSDPGSLRPSKPPKPKQPRDYQRPAINDVVKGFKTADRGQLIMACGTGKTLTAWFIKERLAAERTLVLVPSLSLLKQTMREWQTANPRKPFAALPVCSDETVGSLGDDAAVSHTSSLGVPVTTDPAKIAAFLRKRSGPRVVFSTYQSSPQIAAAFKLGRLPQFDLVIADEAHRVAGRVSSPGRALSDFGTVLDPAAIKAKRRLFMTATPRFFTGRVLREATALDYEVASMDDETRFGTVFHKLSFKEAIELGRLTKYQVAIIGVDDATYRDWAERATLVTLDGTNKTTDARSLAGQIGLAKAMKKFDLQRVISFHSRVKAARDFAASMPEVLAWMPARQRPKGRLWSKYASGAMSAGERDVLLQHLKRLDDGERGLLANARCLSEGVDVPALDGVAFIDPRRSEVDIVQAVGRAIRKSESKKAGTIVISVFINADEDPEVALNSSVFKPVWDVIKALRAHDDALGEELDALRREMGRKGGKPQLPRGFIVDLPKSVSREFARAFNIRLVDATTAPWEFWYGLMTKYVEKKKTAQIPSRCVFEGYRLGSWVNSQRTDYARGDLLPERVRLLEAIPGWIWDVHDDLWATGFSYLLRYVEQYHTARAPGPVVFEGYRLGQWVGVQRTTFAQGALRDDRRRQLEALPDWSWNVITDLWFDGYSRLKNYIDRHGEIPRQWYTEPDGYRLGSWVTTQRITHKNGRLGDEQTRLLEALPGWAWNSRDAKWEFGFQRLNDYMRKNPNGPLPPQTCIEPDGYKLGSWVIVQRTNRDKGTLSEERQKRLESIPGWSWEPLTEAWEQHFQELLDYIAEYGTSRVHPKRIFKGFPLGKWILKQRSKYRAGKLTKDQQDRLEALPDWRWTVYAKKAKRLSADEKGKLSRLAAAGMSTSELVAKFGVSRTTVQRITTTAP